MESKSERHTVTRPSCRVFETLYGALKEIQFLGRSGNNKYFEGKVYQIANDAIRIADRITAKRECGCSTPSRED